MHSCMAQDGSMVCFFWRSLECELCKIPYPPVVKIVDSNSYSSSDDEQRLTNKYLAPHPSARYRRMSDTKASYGTFIHLLVKDVE